ncbi:major facilitator superfamily domain-containing protein [Lipomyces japonicus]|uniref:major facilitator superfamily domain-containing protein n=1 Tax=Lipomyces japonicus TaxID=56871 RepID=UPI0034CECD5E
MRPNNISEDRVGEDLSESETRPNATLLNVLAYLLSCFFSIAFLVFLNSMQSFILTVLLHLKDNIGDFVGTLGFTDELVSVIMCPLWGSLSDKIGTRLVCSMAYILVGTGLVIFVSARNMYPELLILRMVFAVGGSGTAAMVTALLSEISGFKFRSITSHNSSDSHPEINKNAARNGNLSGLVGLFTGFGAVIAVTVFLPIPNKLEKWGLSPEDALRRAFHIVGGLAIAVAIILFFTLRQDPNKSVTKWINELIDKNKNIGAADINDNLHDFDVNINGTGANTAHQERELEGADYRYPTKNLSYFSLLLKGFTAASEPDICLAYIGGLVARSASVAVSAFIPLYINQWFYDQELCSQADNIKESCRSAYILSSMLTGVAETFALVAAPFWGYSCDRFGKERSLAGSAFIGVVGFFTFAIFHNPQHRLAFLWVSLIGVSQIGAIVCSLSLCTARRTEYSGSIAGVYSVTGAVGILFLTKLGGWASDKLRGTPFFIMSFLNLLLLVVSLKINLKPGYFSLLGRDRLLSGVEVQDPEGRGISFRESELSNNSVHISNNL